MCQSEFLIAMMKYLKFQFKRKDLFWLATSELAVSYGWEAVVEQNNHGSKSREYLRIQDVPPLCLILSTQGPSIEDGVAHFQASEACLESTHTDTPISILHRLSRQFLIQINLIKMNHRVCFFLMSLFKFLYHQVFRETLHVT